VTPRPDAGRAVALVLPGESLVCPHGHATAAYVHALAGGAVSVYRCQHRPPSGGPACDDAFLVLPSVMLAADVTTKMLVEMGRRPPSPGQLPDILGLRWRVAREDVEWDSEEIVAHRAMIAPRTA
jgi:hypothetical protein